MTIKKLSLILITFITAVFTFDYLNLGRTICTSHSCITTLNEVLLGYFLLACICLLLLIIFKYLPISYFTKWWQYAKYAVPLTVGLLTMINSGAFHSQSVGMAGMGSFFESVFDLFMLIVSYGLFVVGSLFQMFRVYVESSKYTLDK
jgi:hypothetical protein